VLVPFVIWRKYMQWINVNGTQEFGKMANSFDQQYYLVNEEKAQGNFLW
jgi:hypothetical protein